MTYGGGEQRRICAILIYDTLKHDRQRQHQRQNRVHLRH